MTIIPQDTPQKQCSKCKIFFPATLEFFYKDKKFGLRHYCKICSKAYNDASSEYRKQRHQANREKHLEYGKQHYQEHREALLERQKQYYQTHREERNEYAKQYRKAYPDLVREQERQKRKKHREKIRERKKQWQQSTVYKTYQKHYQKQYIQTERGKLIARSTRHRRRAQKKVSVNACTPQQLQEQLKRQHGKCYYCKKKLGTTYHIDHIVPLSRNGTHDIHNIVMACPSCNLHKSDKLPHEWPEGNRLL